MEQGNYENGNDPDFVEWMAFFYDTEKEGNKYTVINTHKCTEEDYSEFHDIVGH